MAFQIKRWTQLGLGAAFATSALAGCSQPAPSPGADATTEQAAAAPAEESAMPEMGGAGEGGEGEGGVSMDAAAHSPVVYNTALAVAEAHVLAARDAYAAGDTRAASEMFAHPVSEVLFDMEPVLEAQGVEDFTDLLLDASAATIAGESVDSIRTRTDGILAALHAATLKAPDDGTQPAGIEAGVTADLIGRSVTMYRIASESAELEPYLDGYGFYSAAALHFGKSEAAIRAANADAADAMQEVVSLLAAAYPSALRPATLEADQSALTVASSNVLLAMTE